MEYRPKRVLICCESGWRRSKDLAKELSREFRVRGIEAKIKTAGIRNKAKSPYNSPLKFLAYMFTKRLTKELADWADQIVVVENWMINTVTNYFEQPKGKVLYCETLDYALPLFNPKPKEQIKNHIKEYFNK